MRTPKQHVAKDGTKTWIVRYRSSDKKQRSETFDTYADAVEWAKLLDAWGPARALAWLDDEERLAGKGSVTVGELWDRWFTWKSSTRGDGTPKYVRSTRTLEDYERKWKLRIERAFGSTPVDMVSPEMVQDWIDHLDLDAKTIADYHSLLHQMFLWGTQPSRGIAAADPCTNTVLPKRTKKPPKGLRENEWRILHQAAQEVDPDAADVLLFFVASSWRWSEMARVTVAAVDHWIELREDGSEESFTTVTMGRVLRREAGNRYVVVEDAKSLAGQRRVRLKGSAEAMILRRIEGKPLDALIFTTKNGAPLSYNRFHQRVWTRPANKKHDPAPKKKRILERATELGIGREGITLHWLRHTGIGFLILSGEPLTSISRHAGHASIKTTADVYGRMVDAVSSSGLDRAAAMIDGPAPKPLSA